LSSVIPYAKGIQRRLLKIEVKESEKLQVPPPKGDDSLHISYYLLQRLKELNADRLLIYETRSNPRMVTLLDPRYRKSGFSVVTNYDAAKKAVQSSIIEK